MNNDPYIYGEPEKASLVLAHGAGADAHSDFMQYFAKALAKNGFEVILFNFPYMQKRVLDGKRRPPDRAPKLLEHYKTVLESIGPRNKLFIGGKSMGGRIASMALAENNELAAGLILLGYPFAPPGKPEKLRTEHFPSIQSPTLIAQGERDTFGGETFISNLTLPTNFKVHILPDGDHSFKPRKKSGYTEQENWDSAIKAITDFCS